MPTNHSLRNELGVPLVMQPPHRTCEVCVILPARDESARIDKCLSALADQIDLGRVPIYPGRYEVIVLANNCRDETAALARAFWPASSAIGFACGRHSILAREKLRRVRSKVTHGRGVPKASPLGKA